MSCDTFSRDVWLGSEITIRIDTLPYHSITNWISNWIQGFQTQTEPKGRTVKTRNRDENLFFKHKELDFLLIP